MEQLSLPSNRKKYHVAEQNVAHDITVLTRHAFFLSLVNTLYIT